MKIVRAGESDASLNRIESYLISGDCIEPDGVIFRNSYVVAGDLVAPHIKAEYNLTVLGSINCDELEVNNNLTVIGRLVAKQVNVGGEVLIQDEFRADEILIKGSLQAKRVNLRQAVIYKQLISMSTINIFSSLETQGMIVASEGISGSGTISSPVTICGEYNDVKQTNMGNKFILSDLVCSPQNGASVPTKATNPSQLPNDKHFKGNGDTKDQEKKDLITATQIQKKNRNRLL